MCSLIQVKISFAGKSASLLCTISDDEASQIVNLSHPSTFGAFSILKPIRKGKETDCGGTYTSLHETVSSFIVDPSH